MAIKTVSFPQTATALQDATIRAERVVKTAGQEKYSMMAPFLVTCLGVAFPTLTSMLTLYGLGSNLALWQRIENRESIVQESKVKVLSELESQPELSTKMERVFRAQGALFNSLKLNNGADAATSGIFSLACLNYSFNQYARNSSFAPVVATGALIALATGYRSVENPSLYDAQELLTATEDAALSLAKLTSTASPTPVAAPKDASVVTPTPVALPTDLPVLETVAAGA